MHFDLDGCRQVAAVRLSPATDSLTTFDSDGGVQSETHIDLDVAKEIVAELGLMPGGTSDDGVRHWWR